MKSISLWLGAIILYLLSLLIVANDAFKNGRAEGNRRGLEILNQHKFHYFLNPNNPNPRVTCEEGRWFFIQQITEQQADEWMKNNPMGVPK